jgi:hypothetical protein
MGLMYGRVSILKDVLCHHIILKEGFIIELPSLVAVTEASIHPPMSSCTDPT